MQPRLELVRGGRPFLLISSTKLQRVLDHVPSYPGVHVTCGPWIADLCQTDSKWRLHPDPWHGHGLL